MKILLDARLYGLEHAGIGRYIKNLVDNLVEIDKENDYVILLKSAYFHKLKVPDNWEKVLVEINHYTLKEQFLLPKVINKLKPDLVHFPHFNFPIFYSGKYLVTIHDLIKHTSKGKATTTKSPLLYWPKYLAYQVVFSKAVNGASKIIVPSETVKNDLVAFYNLPRNKVIVTYEGVDKNYSNVKLSNKKNEEVLDKYKIKGDFIIYTGSVYPHKNVERLLEAVKIINLKVPISLVISCSRSVFWSRLERKIKDLGLTNIVKLVGFVPDDDLVILYKNAKAFVFPTLSEGFGLPGLESMSVRLPVACSDIPILREIYKDASLYFDPLDPNDIAIKIETICKDISVRERLIKNGLSLIKKYSWQRMSQETLEIYQSSL